MPVNDNLPAENTDPWYEGIVAAWEGFKTFVNDLEVLVATKIGASDLAAGLATKVNTSTYTTGLSTKVNTTAVGQAGGVAGLDGTGKVPVAQLPPIALSDFLGTTTSQAQMLALIGQRGDWTIRTDTGTTWILKAEPSTTLASWQELPNPSGSDTAIWGAVTGSIVNQTDLINLVNQRAPINNPTFTGTVGGVTKAMVGLGSVDNTSDAGKPVSTATQAALDLKASLNGAAFTVSPTVPTPAAGDNSTKAASTAFVQTALTSTAAKEAVEDVIGQAIIGVGVAVAYNDTTGKTTLTVTGGSGGVSGYEALMANVVGDGVANDRAAIQAIIDAGYAFEGRYGDKYKIVGCLFYDNYDTATGTYRSGGLFQQPYMDVQGELIFDNMPQVQPIDPATGANAGALLPRVGIAVGWKRNAWNTTTNIIKLAESGAFSTKAYYRNSVSDDDGTPMAFELRNTRITAPTGTAGGTGTTSTSEANAIVVQSIVGGLRFKNVIFGFFRSLSTWYGYTDVHTIDGCHIDGPSGYFDADGENGSSLVEQRDYGDAISIRNCKTNGGFIAKLFRARGATIESYVTGRILLKDCEDILITGGHDERNISSNDGVTIIRSSVTFNRMQMYSRDTQGGTKTLGPNIIIDDDNNGQYDDVGSVVVFRDFHQVRRIESANMTHGPLIHFLSTHRNTRVEAYGLEAYEVTNLSPGQSRRSPLYFATSGISQVNTGLADKNSQIMIASGHFTFSPIRSTWAARNHFQRMSYDAPAALAPNLTSLGPSGSIAGGLGNAAAYEYAVSLEFAPGRFTAPVTKATTSSASGSVKIVVSEIEGPCIMHIWRSTTDAVALPSHYIAGLVHTRDVHGWDLGTTVFGQSWKTTGIPARPPGGNTVNLQIINGVEKVVT